MYMEDLGQMNFVILGFGLVLFFVAWAMVFLRNYKVFNICMQGLVALWGWELLWLVIRYMDAVQS